MKKWKSLNWWITKIHYIVLLIFGLASLAVALGGLPLFNIKSDSNVLRIILGLLGTLSLFTITDIFIDRDKTQITLESLSKSFPTASGYFSKKSKLPPFAERLINCNELWISGATLHGLLSNEQIRESIRDFINKGKKLKLLMYSENHELEMHILKLWPPDAVTNTAEIYKNAQSISYNYIKTIVKSVVGDKRNNVQNNVKVFALNTFLPHSLVIFDPNEDDKCIVQVQIDLVGCSSSGSFPVFQLNTLADKEHKKLFIDEFNFLCLPAQSNEYTLK